MKIRRGVQLPEFAQSELRTAYRYPHRVIVPNLDPCFSVRFRRSRKYRIGDLREGIHRSEIFVWVRLEREPVCALKMILYDVPMHFGDEYFLYNMDLDSLEDSRFAETVASCWEDVGITLCAYGPLVQFSAAWAAPRLSQQSFWWQVANHVLSHQIERWSVMVLKAFPLEYEGNVPTGSPHAPFLARRQAAMVRHYKRRLGVIELPGSVGQEGWMYRFHEELADFLPLPVPQLRDEDDPYGFR